MMLTNSKNFLVFFSILSLLMLTSCACQNASQKNELLKQKISKLKAELDKIKRESMVIPFDSLTSYILTTSFNPNIKIHEKGVFRTSLEWRKFPNNIKVECIVDDFNAKINEIPLDGIYRTIEVKYNSLGEKTIKGHFAITLPNGIVKNYDWIANPIVTE